jgi:outer membrane immunogenic protein
MRNLAILSCACVALASGAAVAADMPVKAPYLKAPPPSVSWTGCYGGVEAGGLWTRTSTVSNGTTNGVPVGPAAGTPLILPNDFSGVMGGLEAGCNYQFQSFVIGLEGTGDAVGADSTSQSTSPFNPAFSETFNQRWLATVRGRLGFLWDPNTLVFATGGGAWAQWKATDFSSTTISVSENDSSWGWTVGGGVEYWMPGTQWSAKAEYLYIHFKDFTSNFLSPATVSQTTSVSEHIFKIGLNYHFNWGGPVVAKY